MRSFLLFILISASKAIFACGYYPHGEDTRISLFNPHAFGFHLYSEFYYSTNSFEPNPDRFPLNYVDPNTKLWLDYCRGKVDVHSVYDAVYKLTEAEIVEASQNAMIQYLYQKKDNDALNYLRFAKNCEYFNSWQDDPWERETFSAGPKRTELMTRAIQLSEKVKNQELKKRYAFLAIRLAWYNHNYDQVKSLFAVSFENIKDKDILYYWSLYFKSFTEEDHALANFELAQVFAHAPDKRFACHQQYTKAISIDQTLQFAKTDEERANVYLLAAIEKYDKALPYIQKVYELNPTAEGLSFLLLREINKVEDFVLTPSYTLFQPSLSYDSWSAEGKDSSALQTLHRAEHDRIYAKEVLRFINTVNLNKVGSIFFWQSCKAYLQFITKDYNACLAQVSQLEKWAPDTTLATQLRIIKALALTARQPKGNALIPTEVQSFILANPKNGQFIFAIAKELENLGNATDAALLYSRLAEMTYQEDTAYGRNTVYWRIAQNKGNTYSDYYTDYFDYIDAVYTPEQIQQFIEDIRNNRDATNSFSVFKYERVKDQLSRFYDLLGTKYIRQNKLETALAAFEKAGKLYWNRAYTSWDDQTNVFDQNPFYTLKYTPKFIETQDSIRLNKYTITKQLIHYIHQAEDENEKERDYYYFLVATAYYNMSHQGNATMMRRISPWSRYRLSAIEDEPEFRQSNLAKKYYLLARQYAQTEKFRALCLRMAAHCETQKMDFKNIGDWYDFDRQADLSANTYYSDLQANYPDYFDDLTSNCDRFQAYFESRR